jgi:hypothetical protein
MKSVRNGAMKAAFLTTAATSMGLLGTAQADPGIGPGIQGDPNRGMVIVLIDRTGSMSDLGKDCISETGQKILDPITKYHCAVKAARFRIWSDDPTPPPQTKRYFLQAFGNVYGDPTNQQYIWSLDASGNPVRDGSGNVLPAAVTDALAMDQQQISGALAALDLPTQGPDNSDTPLAGAYCTAVTALTAYRGAQTQIPLTMFLESDGLENATPDGVICQGEDSFYSSHFFTSSSIPNHIDLLPDPPTTYIDTADGLLVPTWQSNMLDISATGTVHAPDPIGKVTFASGAFQISPTSTFFINIDFIQQFISSSSLATFANSGLSADSSATREKALRVGMAASVTTNAGLDFLRGIAEITGGRFMTFGSGATPAPSEPMAPHAVPGDVDDSGCVDLADYNLLKQFYNQKISPSQPLSYAADINYNGAIDINDYLMMKANYGQGCAQSPGDFPVLQQSIFGFDTLTDWSSPQASLALVSRPRTEGDYAMSIGQTGFRTINSIKFATSSFEGVTSSIALDVAPPANVTNSCSLGRVWLYANCPSAFLYHRLIGTVSLDGSQLGTFSTFTFQIPPAIRHAMLTAHSDFSFSISLNSNDPGYLVDNLRFSGCQ